ncbi:MAG: T9SS type A sorting domain-containing protein, partial [Hymenobacter sp.]
FATYDNNQAFYNEVAGTATARFFRILARKSTLADGGFSIYEFALFGNATPLPVSLASFTAVPQGSAVTVKWTTASEQNNAGFEVQRSTDGVQFKGIGEVAATGNSQSLKAYQYFDAAPARPVSYYRLKQVDLDGRTTYGPVAVVRLAGAAVAQSFTIYPNPVADRATLQWDAPIAGPSRWRLISTTGQVVRQGVLEAAQGANSQFIDLHNCAAGSYVLSVEAAGQPTQRKLVQKVQ